MVAKVKIEIEGDLRLTDVYTLKQYILSYCEDNKVDSYSFRQEDEYGVRVK